MSQYGAHFGGGRKPPRPKQPKTNVTSEREWVKRMTATYRTEKGLICDLDKLAETYVSIGNIPERLSFDKAAEIALLCQVFLDLRKPKKDARDE